MSKEDGYKIRAEQGIHFVTFAVVEWVDVFAFRDAPKLQTLESHGTGEPHVVFWNTSESEKIMQYKNDYLI